MQVAFTHFSPHAPVKTFYRQGEDCLKHEFDLGYEDILYLLKELRNHRSSLWVEAPLCSLNYSIEESEALWIEICGDNGLWAVSEINLEMGVGILQVAFDGGEFGELIPTTDRVWDAYSGI